MKYADELVLLAREEIVLQGITDRLIEFGRWCGMEMNVGKTQIMIDQEEPENLEYFNSLGSRVYI